MLAVADVSDTAGMLERRKEERKRAEEGSERGIECGRIFDH
jgi:hypothetical protein